jgi:excisionase family DNA binding protein
MKKLQDSPERLLTPKEAAERLAITVEQLADLVMDGAIAYIAVGRGSKRPRRRYTEADLNDFIERRRRREVSLPTNIGRGARNTSLVIGRAKRFESRPIGFMALREEMLATKRNDGKA